MELKLTHESICINEIIFDGTLEQAIELDYLMPDYCPCIFKVLKCKVIPKITSERLINGKLTVDGIAYIKILYVSEESYKIRSITQKQIFSKSTDLRENGDSENAIITSSIKCDYANCRVVNQKRLDIRGAISIKATVSTVKKIDVLSSACGMGIQVCNKKVIALDKKLYASKEFSITEELELGYGKPAIGELLDYSANASLTEYKVIANKVIIKGEIVFHTLYCPQESEEQGNPEIMDYTIPISQIIDVPGVNDEYKCIVTFDITNVETDLQQNSDNECKCIEVEFGIRVCCEANKNTSAQLINDIYSTSHELQSSASQIKVEQLMGTVNEKCICKSNIPIPKGDLNCVYDISCDFSNESCKFEDGYVKLAGNLYTSILALDCENMPVIIEKTSPCEMKINANFDEKTLSLTPHIAVSSVSYNMTANDEIEVRAEINLCANLYKSCYYNVISNVTTDENAKKQEQCDCVIRLYFAQRGEKIWDIAKRFNTSMDLITAENDLECEELPDKMMLLIPSL